MEPVTDVREISKIAYGFIASRALFAALELDLFTRLSGQSKTLEALSQGTRVSDTLLLPFLTSLVSYNQKLWMKRKGDVPFWGCCAGQPQDPGERRGERYATYVGGYHWTG